MYITIFCLKSPNLSTGIDYKTFVHCTRSIHKLRDIKPSRDSLNLSV